MAIVLLGFSACSNDDDKVQINFPEKQAIDCAAGEVKTLTFNAENSWTLASSRLWCKFKDGNDIVSSISGGPGEQTVTITVTEEVWGFEDAVADIVIGMQGQTQVIATVNRAAKGYKAEAYQMNGENKEPFNEANPAVISYLGALNISFDANFDWKLKNCPEWLKVQSADKYEERTMMGDANKVTSWIFEFKSTENFAKGKEQNINLEFIDTNGTLRLTVPLHYEGIPEDKIEFTPTTTWNLNFSADGKEYWQTSGMGEVTKYPMPRIVTTVTKEGFELVYLKNDSRWGYTPCSDYEIPTLWFKANVNGDQIEMTVEPNQESEARKGCLMAFPKKVFEGLDIYSIITDGEPSEIKSQYEKYVVADFTQEMNQSTPGGFNVIDYNGEALELEYMGNNYDAVETYNTTNIYSLTLNPMSVYPMLSITPVDYPLWPCQYEKSMYLWNLDSSKFEVDGKTLNIFDLPTVDGSMDIIFKDGEGNNFGVLLISLWH